MVRQRFPNEPSSIPAARHFVRAALEGTDAELRASAELAVSELATNALLHTDGDLSVAVHCHEEGVRVEVGDSSGALPRLRRPAPDDPSGRGMLIVEAVADEWGVELLADGKVVWFTLRGDREVALLRSSGARRPAARGG